MLIHWGLRQLHLICLPQEKLPTRVVRISLHILSRYADLLDSNIQSLKKNVIMLRKLNASLS